MKIHALFTAVLLAAALLGGAGCNGNTSETETPLPVLENAGQVTLAGGRNRIVCRWTGMPQEVASIRIRLGDDGTPHDIPAGDGNGEKELTGIEEGSRPVEIRYITNDGEVFAGPEPTVTVYGDRYEASLKNRTVTGAYFAGASATVTLANYCPEGIVGQEFTYVSAVGEPRTRYCKALHDGSMQTVTFDDAGGDI